MKILAYGGFEIRLSNSVDLCQLRTALADLAHEGGGWRDVSDDSGATHTIWVGGSTAVRLTERIERTPPPPVSVGPPSEPLGEF